MKKQRTKSDKIEAPENISTSSATEEWKHFGLELLSRKEYEKWLKTIVKGSCPFCEWRKYQYILYRGRHWLWIACRSPYWKYHTMFVPKRHFIEMNEMTVIEMGELIEMYSLAVRKFREVNSGEKFRKYLFFWRLRDDPTEASKSDRVVHFHMHFVPDRQGLLDPILEVEACDWDPSQLVIEPHM